MTARELIEMLKNLPLDAEVCAWDGDVDDYCPVTGAVFEDGHTFIELQTDDIT